MIRISVVAALLSSVSFADQANQQQEASSQFVHRSYPVLSMAAGLACKSVIAVDNAASKFCDHLVLSGAFAAADEISEVLVQHDLIESKRDAHTLATVPMLAASAVFGKAGADTLSKTAMASGTNQIGKAGRELVKDHAKNSTDFVKGTSAAVTLGTLAIAGAGRGPNTFIDKVGVSSAYTFAYVLREAAIDSMRNVTTTLPELKVAGIFSAIGAVGMAITTPIQIPYFVSAAVLEAGAFIGAEEAIKWAKGLGLHSYVAMYGSAVLGSLLYIPAAKANNAAKRIISNIGQALMLPGAFSMTFDFAKYLMSPPKKEISA